MDRLKVGDWVVDSRRIKETGWSHIDDLRIGYVVECSMHEYSQQGKVKLEKKYGESITHGLMTRIQWQKNAEMGVLKSVWACVSLYRVEKGEDGKYFLQKLRGDGKIIGRASEEIIQDEY